MNFFTFFIRNLSLSVATEVTFQSFKIFSIFFFGTLSGVVGTYFAYKQKGQKLTLKDLQNKLLIIFFFMIIFAGVYVLIKQKYAFFIVVAVNFVFFIMMFPSLEEVLSKMEENYYKKLSVVLLFISLVIVMLKLFQFACVKDAEYFMSEGYKKKKRVCLSDSGICGHFVSDNGDYLCLKKFNVKRTVCYKKDQLNEIVFKSNINR